MQRKIAVKSSQAEFPSLQRHSYGYAELKFTARCFDIMPAGYIIEAISSNLQGDATFQMPSPYPFKRYIST
jgi:hypothetical protein